MTTSRKITLGFFALIALAVLVERLIVTDREAIEKSLDVMARAAERRDVATLHGYVSPKYNCRGMDAAMFKAMVEAILKDNQIEKVGFMKQDIKVSAPYATVELKAMVHIKASGAGAQALGIEGGAALFRLRVAMEKTEEGWLVVECENLGPG